MEDIIMQALRENGGTLSHAELVAVVRDQSPRQAARLMRYVRSMSRGDNATIARNVDVQAVGDERLTYSILNLPDTIESDQ